MAKKKKRKIEGGWDWNGKGMEWYGKAEGWKGDEAERVSFPLFLQRLYFGRKGGERTLCKFCI